MKQIAVIKGNGFTLRPLKKTDYRILARKINDRNIYRYTLNIPYPYTLADARKWLSKIVKQYKQKPATGFHLAIVIDGELAGCVSLMKIEKNHKAELGYWLAREHWGRGITSRAVAAMVKLGFRKFGLKKIYAYVFVKNKASYKVLLKNGFKKEGLLIQHVKKDGKLEDEYIVAKYK